MNNKNESLLDLAFKALSKKRKPYTLPKIAEEAFELKGEKMTVDKLAQFQMDFMLSGSFICCGEDANGHKLWDLKNRQPSSLQDKDGSYLDDKYSDDEDVLKNELSDDLPYKVSKKYHDDDDIDDEDEDDEDEERDDIEEELSYLDDEDEEDVIDDEEDDELEEDFDLIAGDELDEDMDEADDEEVLDEDTDNEDNYGDEEEDFQE